MKKLFIILLTSLLITMPVFAKTDKTSIDYLKNIVYNGVKWIVKKQFRDKVESFWERRQVKCLLVNINIQ